MSTNNEFLEANWMCSFSFIDGFIYFRGYYIENMFVFSEAFKINFLTISI